MALVERAPEGRLCRILRQVTRDVVLVVGVGTNPVGSFEVGVVIPGPVLSPHKAAVPTVLLDALHKVEDGLAPPVTHKEGRRLRLLRDKLDKRDLLDVGRRLNDVASGLVQGHNSRREHVAADVGPALGRAAALDVAHHLLQLLDGDGTIRRIRYGAARLFEEQVGEVLARRLLDGAEAARVEALPPLVERDVPVRIKVQFTRQRCRDLCRITVRLEDGRQLLCVDLPIAIGVDFFEQLGGVLPLKALGRCTGFEVGGAVLGRDLGRFSAHC